MVKYNIDSFSFDDINKGKIILVDKPINWTSFDVVKFIRKSLQLKFKTKKIKVGHAGTLDPLATGLLIICIGKQTKNISEYQDLAKTYIGKFKLGETTLSYDAETDVIEKFKYEHITINDLKELANEFIGNSMQKPPIYSAIKKNGKRLYDYARKNYRGICVLRHEDTGQVRAIRYSRTGGGSWGNIQRIRDRVVETTLNFTRLDEDVLDVLRNIVKNKQMQKVKFKDKKTASVDMFTASAMVKVYDALNKDNQGKFKDMINKNKGGFMAMQSFAMKKVR